MSTVQLDPEQAAVVDAIVGRAGHVRVVAAAGSGKSRVVIASVVGLLNAGVEPEKIVVTTFTRKAADELLKRIGDAGIPKAVSQALRVGTFHSTAIRALGARDRDRWSLDRCISIGGKLGVTTDHLWRAIVDWAPGGAVPGSGDHSLGQKEHEPREYQSTVDWIRSRGMPSQSDAAIDFVLRHPAKCPPQLLKAWAMYEKAKQALGAWDFQDAIEAYGATVAARESITVALVDEAQDTDVSQKKVIVAWAGAGTKIGLLGDARQAIYAFRGADPDVFLDLGTELGMQTLSIPTNYRSVQRIVDFGTEVAGDAPWAQVGDQPRAHRANPADRTVVSTIVGADQDDEARAVLADIVQQKRPFDQMAILVRTNTAAARFEALAMEARVPVLRLGRQSFWTTYAVQDFLAWAALTEFESGPALERVYNKPNRFIKKETIREVLDAIHQGRTVLDALGHVAQVRGKGAGIRLIDLKREIESIRRLAWPARVTQIAKMLAPAAETTTPGTDEPETKRDKLVFLAAIAARFASAADFVRYADACAQNVKFGDSKQDSRGRVTIATCHAAKGLQWPRVYVSASQGVLPHARAEALDEERRLFYVAVTRAEDSLVLSWTNHAKPRDGTVLFGPSEFIPAAMIPARRPFLVGTAGSAA